MDSDEFRTFANAAIQYIADYHDSLENRHVRSAVLPGFLTDHLPKQIPKTGEPWQKLLDDVDKIIIPGITHWHSPHFHAFYPEGSSYPCVVGELLTAGLGNVAFNWISSPVATELEDIIVNWVGKMIGLPREFLNSFCRSAMGGGVIMNSASESTLIALIAAKKSKILQLQLIDSSLSDYEIERKLVAYSSNEANSLVEKASKLGSMQMRLLKVNINGQLTKETLQKVIDQDKAKGLISCFVVGTLGTTALCSFDNLEDLGHICQKEKLWFHVDAAYAGTAFACPENRYLMKEIEYVDSFVINAHKWMLVTYGTCVTWYKDLHFAKKAFKTQSDYSCNDGELLPENKNYWSLAKGKNFKALKLWISLRIYGISGIQQ